MLTAMKATQENSLLFHFFSLLHKQTPLHDNGGGVGWGGLGCGGEGKSARSTLDFELIFLPVAGRVYSRLRAVVSRWGGVGVGKSARSTLDFKLNFPPVARCAYSHLRAVVSRDNVRAGWGGVRGVRALVARLTSREFSASGTSRLQPPATCTQ